VTVKQIKILGPGCTRCRQMVENTEQAVKELDIACEIEKITDIDRIVTYGVLKTPGLVVDGEIRSSGKVLTPEEIKALLS
jgi:small redox-active disulfide protein 2